MKRGLLVFFAMCVLTIAMVPRDRRAINTEEQQTTTEKKKENHIVCAPETPCRWILFKVQVKIVELNITNLYCECGEGQICVADDIFAESTYTVYRCRDPNSLTTTTDSSVSDSSVSDSTVSDSSISDSSVTGS